MELFPDYLLHNSNAMEKVKEFLFQAFGVLILLLALSLLFYQAKELTEVIEEAFISIQYRDLVS